MLLPALVILFSGAAPRGPSDVDRALYIPRLDRVPTFTEFLNAGGARSVLLRSENWRDALHPLLRFDITRPESVNAAGVDETASMSWSQRGALEISCVTIKNPERFHAACADALKPLGAPFKKAEGKATVYAAKDTLDRVLAGYVVVGKESCAVRMQGQSVESTLNEVKEWLKQPATGPMWKLIDAKSPAAAYWLMPQGVLALGAEGPTLNTTARGPSLPLAGLKSSGMSPYQAFPAQGMLTLKVLHEPQRTHALVEKIGQHLNKLCPACDNAPFKTAMEKMKGTFTGAAMVMLSHVKVTGSLQTDPGRFFSVRFAAFAETQSPVEAKVAVMDLKALGGARPLDNGDGVSLLLKEGEVRIGVRGRHLFIANDPKVLETAYEALPTQAAMQKHGAEIQFDPQKVAKGLAQVPLMDALTSTELAGVLAAGIEMGPLLLATEQLNGWADAQKASFHWKLAPPKKPTQTETPGSKPNAN